MQLIQGVARGAAQIVPAGGHPEPQRDAHGLIGIRAMIPEYGVAVEQRRQAGIGILVGEREGLVKPQGEVAVFDVAGEIEEPFHHVGDHVVVTGSLASHAGLQKSFSRAAPFNGQIGGPHHRCSHALVAGQLGVVDEAPQKTGLGPQIARHFISEIGGKDAQIAVGILRGEDMADVSIRLGHGGLISGEISHHDVARSPVALGLAVPPVHLGDVAGILLDVGVAMAHEDIR